MDYVVLLLAILLAGWCIIRDIWLTNKVFGYVDSLMTLAHAKTLTEGKLVGMVTDPSRPLNKDHFKTLVDIAQAPEATESSATGAQSYVPEADDMGMPKSYIG